MVPNGWEEKRLGKVAEFQRGFDLPSAKRLDGNIPIISSSGVSGFHNESKVKAPGIVTGRYGTIGNVFLINEDFWPLNTSLWVKDFHQNEIKFIYYLLQSFDFKKFSDKTGVPGVNRNDLHAVKVKVPPLPEQQKIAKILTTWDKAIDTTERLIDNSKQHKKALMQQLLTGKKRLLDESGKRFESELGKSTLSKLCQISTGKKDVNEGNPNGKYPFYTCAKEHTFSDAYSFDCEALLIAGNGNIGTTHYHNGKFEAYQRTYVLKEFKDINIKYLFQFLLYALNREVERNKQHGAMPYIKVGFLNNFIVLTPSLEEQQKIATLLTNADQEIDLLEQQLADLQQEKKALMQVLLTGKKRVVVDGED